MKKEKAVMTERSLMEEFMAEKFLDPVLGRDEMRDFIFDSVKCFFENSCSNDQFDLIWLLSRLSFCLFIKVITSDEFHQLSDDLLFCYVNSRLH